jgi:WD40 repeat protein
MYLKDNIVLYGHLQWVNRILYIDNSSSFITISTDGYLKVWSINQLKIIKEFRVNLDENDMTYKKGLISIDFHQSIEQEKKQTNQKLPPKN